MQQLTMIATLGIPARRRIGSSYTTFIYDGGILMGLIETVSAIRTLWSTVETAIEKRDVLKLQQLELEMGRKLLDLVTAANELAMSNSELNTKKRDLEHKIAKLEQRIQQKTAYQLHQPYPGVTVYATKGTDEHGNPAHYACPTCFQKESTESILQFTSKDLALAVCYLCNKTYRFRDDTDSPKRRSHDPYSRI